jgi:preprotein translocase subunit SecE
VGSVIGSQSEGLNQERQQPRPAPGAAGPFRTYKPGQGIHVRWGTAIGAAVLSISGAYFMYEQLRIVTFGNQSVDEYFHMLVPVALLAAAMYGIYRVVGRAHSAVDFMIATEGEMKKVNWSTRREVWGATKVVIVTVLALGFVLALVDAMFMAFFGSVGVLKNVKIFELFVGGEG